MDRYRQSAFIVTLMVGLITLVAACGVQETANSPTEPGATVASRASPTDQKPPTAPDPSASLQQATSALISSAQTSLAIRSMIETDEAQAQLTGQAPPTWNAETSTAISKLFDGERTRIAQAPTTTPSILSSTPFVGPGKLLQDGQSPFPSMDFIGTNSWYYKVGDKILTVYVGRQGVGTEHDQDIKQGMVVVVDWTTGAPRTVSSNKTPVVDGPAQIVDVQVEGEQITMTIVTEGGSRYHFDVNTGQFTPLP